MLPLGLAHTGRWRPFPTPGMGVDWWTLGCLLYEMITGRGPFNHPDMSELLRLIVNSDPVYPSYASPPCVACIKALMCRDAGSRLLGGAALRGHAFYAGLDWDALARVELPAPWQPFGGPESPHPNTMCENRERLRDGFGSSWTSLSEAPAPAKGDAGSAAEAAAEPAGAGTAENPMVGKKSTNLALALELTSEGSTWRVSNPLAELFGQARQPQPLAAHAWGCSPSRTEAAHAVGCSLLRMGLQPLTHAPRMCPGEGAAPPTLRPAAARPGARDAALHRAGLAARVHARLPGAAARDRRRRRHAQAGRAAVGPHAGTARRKL